MCQSRQIADLPRYCSKSIVVDLNGKPNYDIAKITQYIVKIRIKQLRHSAPTVQLDLVCPTPAPRTRRRAPQHVWRHAPAQPADLPQLLRYRIKRCLLPVLALLPHLVHPVPAHTAQPRPVALLAQALAVVAPVAVVSVPVRVSAALDLALPVLGRAHRHSAPSSALPFACCAHPHPRIVTFHSKCSICAANCTGFHSWHPWCMTQHSCSQDSC